MTIIIESEHMPPSTNNLFANIPGKGRVKSERYHGWLMAAGWDCRRKPKIIGPFRISLVFSRGKRRKGSDLDNKIKPILDLLVKHMIIEDDSLCESITAEWKELPAPLSWRAEVWDAELD